MSLGVMLSALPLNIDWQQILLHLLNFLILAVVLGLFVYKPVKKFLDARKKRFEDREKDIAEKKKNAEDMQSEYERRLHGVDDEIEHKRETARREAEESAKRTTDAADMQAAEILSRAHSGAEAQKRKLVSEAGADISAMVVTATEKLLAASQSEETDSALYDRFVSESSSGASAEDLSAGSREAELAARAADAEAERIINAARVEAAKDADEILDAAKSGLADVVAAAAEKLLDEIGTSDDAALYDKFLAEASRSDSK